MTDVARQGITRLELIVNLAAAREIGVTIPARVLRRADQLVE